MQSEGDLKELTTAKVMQLVTLFLNETLEVYPPAETLLADNYSPEMFSQGALPYEFKNLEETLRVTNANLVLYQCLSMLCQHIQFDLEYMIFP
jgi:hypothetical protein